MKIFEMVNYIKALARPELVPQVTCDKIIIGNADKEIKKVAVSMFATPDLIREISDWGANFLIVHEPLCYAGYDEVVTYEIGHEKKKLVEEKGVTIFRFHDHAHAMNPDLIYDGQLKYMGLVGTRIKGDYFAVNRFQLKNEMTAFELAKYIEQKLGIKHIKIAGCTDKKGKNISCCFGTPGHVVEELSENDFVLTGEMCEWKEAEAVRDYAQLGYNKAVLVMGHIGSEREGMRLLSEMISEKFPEFETKYFECDEVYSYTD